MIYIQSIYFDRELEDESSDESEAEMDIDVYSTVGGQKAKHDLMMKSEVGYNQSCKVL